MDSLAEHVLWLCHQLRKGPGWDTVLFSCLGSPFAYKRREQLYDGEGPSWAGRFWLIVTYPSLTQSRIAYTPVCQLSKRARWHIPSRVFKWTFFVILDGISKGCWPLRIPCTDAGSPERLAAEEEKCTLLGECCSLSRAYGVLGRGVSASWPPSPLLPHCFPCPAFAGLLERLERFDKCFLKSDNFSKWSRIILGIIIRHS